MGSLAGLRYVRLSAYTRKGVRVRDLYVRTENKIIKVFS